MKQFAVILILVLSGIVQVYAQSGRIILPTPTPTPDAEDVYSESKPYKSRKIYPPNWRKKRETKKETKPETVQTVQTNDENLEIIKIDSTLVTIPVSVFDEDGIYVPDLKRENFTVFEDGREQKIEYFGDSEKPFTVVLLLDTSYSAEYDIKQIQDAAASFVRLLSPDDGVIVIEFDRNSHVLTKLTKDREKIYKGIKEADFGYGTSLYDAVGLSLNKYLSRIEGRKAIVLFTDGVDTTSRKTTYDKTVFDAEESGVLIFPVYYNTYNAVQRQIRDGLATRGAVGTRPQDYKIGRDYIDELASATGGRVFIPKKTPGGLIRAFEGIAEELRRQYVIGYYSDAEGKPGDRKQIRVRVDRPNLNIRARDSYIVGGK